MHDMRGGSPDPRRTATSGSSVCLLLLTLLSGTPLFATDLSPYHLECEAHINPLGVDSAHPRVSWKLQSDRQGDGQISYQILVASTRAKLDSATGDLWDTGRVESAETTWIPYRGAPLRSFQDAWW